MDSPADNKPTIQIPTYNENDIPDDYVKDTGRILYVIKPDGLKYIAVTDGVYWKVSDKPIDPEE